MKKIFITQANSEGSGKPAHPCCLTWEFAVRTNNIGDLEEETKSWRSGHTGWLHMAFEGSLTAKHCPFLIYNFTNHIICTYCLFSSVTFLLTWTCRCTSCGPVPSGLLWGSCRLLCQFPAVCQTQQLQYQEPSLSLNYDVYHTARLSCRLEDDI